MPTTVETLPDPVFEILEKAVSFLPYHTEAQRLAHFAALDAFREGDLQPWHRAPVNVPDPSAASMASGTPGADNQAMNAKIDALSAQLARMAAAMEQMMAPPVAVPTGTGDVPIEGVISNPSPANPVAVPAGSGDKPMGAPPVA